MQDARQIFMDTRGRAGTRDSVQRFGCRVCPVLALIAAAVWTPAVVAGAAADSAGTGATEVIVRLYPTAVVSADQITLADLAELDGDVGEQAHSWPIAQSPDVGGSRVIDAAHVEKMVARHGANLARWVVRGYTHCTVTRPTRAPANQAERPISTFSNSSDADQNRLVGQPPSGMAHSVKDSPIDPNTLGGALHEHIRKRLANLGGSPMIEFTPAVMKVLGLSRPTYRFVIENQGERLIGMVPLSVTIYQDDRVEQVLRVLARVSLRKPVVVAARQINRGETIGADDLRLEDRVFERVEDIGLTETAPLVGQRATSYLDQGDEISTRDVEPLPLVHRNDLVTVIVRGRNLLIKGCARAMSSGGYGDVVELRNEMAGRSAETYAAVVTGPKTVEVKAAANRSVAMLPAARGGL